MPPRSKRIFASKCFGSLGLLHQLITSFRYGFHWQHAVSTEALSHCRNNVRGSTWSPFQHVGAQRLLASLVGLLDESALFHLFQRLKRAWARRDECGWQQELRWTWITSRTPSFFFSANSTAMPESIREVGNRPNRKDTTEWKIKRSIRAPTNSFHCGGRKNQRHSKKHKKMKIGRRQFCEELAWRSSVKAKFFPRYSAFLETNAKIVAFENTAVAMTNFKTSNQCKYVFK